MYMQLNRMDYYTSEVTMEAIYVQLIPSRPVIFNIASLVLRISIKFTKVPYPCQQQVNKNSPNA